MRHTIAKVLPVVAATLAVALVASPARTSQPEFSDLESSYGDGYQTGDFGRIRHVEGAPVVLRASGAGPERPDALINAPVLPGDELRTGARDRVEVELARGTLVRIDYGSAVRFQALPDPYAEVRDNSVLMLTDGTIRINAMVRGSETFRIDTPAASVYLLSDGDFRVDVTAGGRLCVSSYQGVAEVAADQGSILVRAGTRADVNPGATPAAAQAFNTLLSDPFDRWVAGRDDLYRAAAGGSSAAYDALPHEVRPHYRELSANGSWVYLDDFGWSWYPNATPAGWSPYRDGYWEYGSGGWFWVSHEPWGWAPYHYGRWTWASGYGWTWSAGRVFAGAWVAWSWGSAYLGWAPLDYWNWPGWYYGPAYWGYYYPCWTFVDYDDIHDYHHDRHAVMPHDIEGDEQHRAVSTRPPSVSPRELASTPDARRRAVDEVRAARPALDRTLADARDRDPARATRFREIEDRLARTGARAERSAAMSRDREPTATRAARPSTVLREDRGAPRTATRQETRVSDPELRVRPRQIATAPPAERGVHDVYRRILPQRGDGASPAPAAADNRVVRPRETPAPSARVPARNTAPVGRTPAAQAPSPQRSSGGAVRPAPSGGSRPSSPSAGSSRGPSGGGGSRSGGGASRSGGSSSRGSGTRGSR